MIIWKYRSCSFFHPEWISCRLWLPAVGIWQSYYWSGLYSSSRQFFIYFVCYGFHQLLGWIGISYFSRYCVVIILSCCLFAVRAMRISDVRGFSCGILCFLARCYTSWIVIASVGIMWSICASSLWLPNFSGAWVIRAKTDFWISSGALSMIVNDKNKP